MISQQHCTHIRVGNFGYFIRRNRSDSFLTAQRYDYTATQSKSQLIKIINAIIQNMLIISIYMRRRWLVGTGVTIKVEPKKYL